VSVRAKRRVGRLAFVGLAAALAVAGHYGSQVALRDTQALTGWLLFGLMVLLAFYNVRKKFPVPPMLKSRHWLQFHIYAGLLTGVVFIAHAGITFPNGVFEWWLGLFFLLVFGSGVVGLYISRTFPHRITAKGGEAHFERIPELRRKIAENVENLAEESIVSTNSNAIATFYTTRLRDFFSGPEHIFRHLFGFAPPVNRMLAAIRDQYRYMNEEERNILSEISDYVIEKDRLDHHYALGLALRLWLFVHLPLTYGLMVMSIVHITLAYAFTGKVV